MEFSFPRAISPTKRWRTWSLGLLLSVSLPALADVAVIVSARNPTSSLSKEQASDLFLGKATSFPGGSSASPLDLPESSPVREDFYSKVTGKSASQAKSYWSKMVFTGKGTPPKEMGSPAEVKKAVAGDPALIGYIEKSAVDGTVKVLYTAH